MAPQNRGLTYKRISINLTEELDEAVVKVRARKEFCRCSYVECVRILIQKGAEAMDDLYPDNAGKS